MIYISLMSKKCFCSADSLSKPFLVEVVKVKDGKISYENWMANILKQYLQRCRILTLKWKFDKCSNSPRCVEARLQS